MVNKRTEAKAFPLPSSLKIVPGTEKAQAAYPYYTQFTATDDQRFWFYNSII
jgi:pyruvate,water dikinase